MIPGKIGRPEKTIDRMYKYGQTHRKNKNHKKNYGKQRKKKKSKPINSSIAMHPSDQMSMRVVYLPTSIIKK